VVLKSGTDNGEKQDDRDKTIRSIEERTAHEEIEPPSKGRHGPGQMKQPRHPRNLGEATVRNTWTHGTYKRLKKKVFTRLMGNQGAGQ